MSTISNIIAQYIPQLREFGFNIDDENQSKLLSIPVAQNGKYFRRHTFDNFDLYIHSKGLFLSNNNVAGNGLIITEMSLKYDDSSRYVNYTNGSTVISETTKYNNSIPVRTDIIVNNLNVTPGKPNYKLSEISGKVLSELITIGFEYSYLCLYYKGNRINRSYDKYEIAIEYDESGKIKTVKLS